MAATPQTEAPPAAASDAEMQELARRHLWMHFTRMGSFDSEHEVPIIVKGEGCYVWDSHGNRYLDGLSALFCVNAGHGRTEIADAMAAQVSELDFVTLWSYAHPRAIELATRIAGARPGRPQPRLLHQQRLRGGRVGGQARAQLLQGDRQGHEDQADRPRDRLPRHHHGRARRDRHPAAADPVRAADARGLARPQHRQLPLARGPRPALGRRPDRGEDPLRGPRDGGRGDPGAAAERRRLPAAAGRLLPARARDLRSPRRAADLRRGDLLLGAPGPLLRLRALRLPARHHHHREGAGGLVRADGGDDRLGPGVRAVLGGDSRGSRTGRRSPGIRSRPRPRWRTSTSSSARTCAGT